MGGPGVGVVEAEVVAEAGVATDLITAEPGAVRDLADEGLGEAEGGFVETAIAFAGSAGDVAIEGDAPVEDGGAGEGGDDVDDVSVIDAFQRKGSVLANAEDAVGGAEFGAIVGGVAEEHAVAAAEVMVDFDGEVVEIIFGDIVAAGDEEIAAGVSSDGGSDVGLGVEGGDFGGDGVDAVGWNAVAGERAAQPIATGVATGGGVIDGDGGAAGVDDFGEVALVHFGFGDGENEGVGGAFAVALVGNHEEAFVAAVVELGDVDGAADLAAVLIEKMPGFGGALRVVLEGIGIPGVAAGEFVEGAMDGVSPTL